MGPIRWGLWSARYPSVGTDERMGRAWKLTEQDVREIKLLLNQGTTQVNIAARYGVSQKSISNIKRGVTWEWVSAAPATRGS